MRFIRLLGMCSVFSIVGFAGIGQAGAAPLSSAFTYQGQLNEDGQPVDGIFSMQFDFFDVETGGVSLATQNIASVIVENGLFIVVLNQPDQAQQAPLDGTARWIEITVDGQTLSPRQPLTSVPYASTAARPWQAVDQHAILPTGNVGLGTDAPDAMVHMRREFADTTIRMESSRFQEGPPANEQGSPVTAATTGTGASWSSPTNAIASDDSHAVVAMVGTTGGLDLLDSQFLDITNFGFSLPPQAVVVGISGTVEASGTCSCPKCDRCTVALNVELLGGSGSSAKSGVTLSLPETTVPVGAQFETWGLEWGAAEINSPNFGLRMQSSLGLQEIFICIPFCAYQPCDCTGTGEARVDAVTLTVHYYDVSATTTPLNWTLGMSQNDANFSIAPTADLTNPAIVASTLSNVGIGREPGFTPSQFGNLYYRLDVNGIVRCQSVSTASSRRFKQDVRPVEGAMDKVLSLQGVEYQWDAEHGSRPDVGFIAEDVGRVIPEIVDWEAGGKDAAGMRYDRLTVYAVEAIKQLHADLKQRDSEIAALRKRIEQLENPRHDPQPETEPRP